MFYPISQIKTNLYTNGGEYVYANNKLPYSGDYFITGDNKIYTGKNPNNKPNNLLILNKVNEITPSRSGSEARPQSYYLVDDYYYYAKGIDVNSIGVPPSTPTQIFPTPTKEDYQIGEIQRFFTKKINEISYIEVSQEEFDQYSNQEPTVSYYLYSAFQFPWVLTGNRSDAFNVNKNTIKRTQINNNFQGLTSYFKGKYDQLFKYSSNENLYTDGTEFRNSFTNKPYIGFYHIHPNKGPMEGAQHIDKPHAYLNPITKPSTYGYEKPLSLVTQSWEELRYGNLNGPIYATPKPIVILPPPSSFITGWDIPTDNFQIGIGLDPTNTYNFTVNWGDGSEETITSNSDLLLTYSNSGEYNVTIDGTFPSIIMSNFDGSKPLVTPNNIVSINNWGNIKWERLKFAFRDCINLYRNDPQDTPDLSDVKNMEGMFRNAGSNITPNIIISNIENWDVSNVVDINHLFYGTSFNQDLSNWDVSKVTNFSYMFFNCFYNQPIGNWNVSNAIRMKGMFEMPFSTLPTGVGIFNQDISNWDILKLSELSTFIKRQKLSTINYDKLLIGWEATLQATYPNGSGYPNLVAGVTANFGDSQYTDNSAASIARASLDTNYNWTITDGGIA